MKKLNLLFVLTFFGSLSSSAQNWLTTGNTTTGTEFLGTNAGSSNPNLVFKRAGIFAGMLSQNCVSIGVNSWENSTNSYKGNTMIGFEAGRYTSTDLTSNGINGGNTFIGSSSGKGNPNLLGTSYNNVCVGNFSGEKIETGSLNVFIGARAGQFLSTSGNNICIGYSAGRGNTNVSNGENVIIGSQAGEGNNGKGNVFIGSQTGRALNGSLLVQTSGELNTYIGSGCGKNIPDGSYNTFIGRVTSSNPSISNTIILADGSQNQRFYIHSNGFTGVGLGNNEIPLNRLELKSTGAVANTLGLRFRNCPTTSIVNPTNNVLSVNAQGDVILVEDKQSSNPGALSTTCNTANFITKSSGTTGNLTCSSIYDDGLGHVGFGFGSSLPSTSFNVMFAGNNATYGGSYNVSDKKFKKDIKPIQNALDKIMNLDGKTYFWNKEVNKDINFTSELQYGLLAQEVQKVIPSLVIESENGDLAMNYIGLIPVLIEALKDQQAQINELKQQLTDSFKAKNQDLLQFSNTKIISVSPNPSNDVITISINIDKDVQNATLQVNDINGLLLSSLNIKERSTNVAKTLQKDNFGKGIYIVSLMVNGKSMDTKKIVFN